MRIECPYCGLRDGSEFSYEGDATIIAKRPKISEKSLKAWVDYHYLRDNPLGKHSEIWQHVGGCRQFITALRDTKTHEIFGTQALLNGGAAGGGATKRVSKAGSKKS